jgi:hypothetical protein
MYILNVQNKIMINILSHITILKLKNKKNLILQIEKYR